MTRVAALATLPDRVRMLERTVASLLPQVDLLHVYLDGHDTRPACLDQPKIITTHALRYPGLKSSGKFLPCGPSDHYHFSCDDDIVYPPDYCERMIEALDRHDRRAIVTVYALRFLTDPASLDRMICACTSCPLRFEERMHMPGTGTSVWHTSQFRMVPSRCRSWYMDDLWTALEARALGLPVFAVARPERWLDPMRGTGFTIANARRRGEVPLAAELARHSPWPELPPFEDPDLTARVQALLGTGMHSIPFVDRRHQG